MLHAPAVHLINAHRARMDQELHLLFDAFAHQQDTRAFDAAAGGAGAGADEHEQHQDALAERGPLVEVHRGEAGGRDDGGDLEQRVVQAVKKAAEQMTDVARDQQGGGGNYAKVNAQLLDPERLLPAARQDQEIDVEIYAEQIINSVTTACR